MGGEWVSEIIVVGGCYNSKFLRGHPEKFRASIRIRAITFFIISLCFFFFALGSSEVIKVYT